MPARRSLQTPLGGHSRTTPAWLLAVTFAGIILGCEAAHAYIRPHLRTALFESRGNPAVGLGGEQLPAPAHLRALYRERQYQPLWVTDDGITSRFQMGLQVLLLADRHGLIPAEYHAPRLQALAAMPGPQVRPPQLAEAELLLSDGLIRYGLHLSRGRVEPGRLHPAWVAKAPAADVIAALVELARVGDGEAFERQLAPRQATYWRTLAAARELRAKMQGRGWPLFPVEQTLRPGVRDPAVAVLRRRLQAEGGPEPVGESALLWFDPALEQEVRVFQRRHGLAADGVVGAATRAELQATPADRYQQLLLTLERLRWLPRRWQGRLLVVNVADFALEAWQDDESILEMRVIVGSPGRKTPVLHQRLERVEINPYWKVPQSIAVQELLPRIREDCGYLQRNGFELVSSYSDAADVLDPAAIDWKQVGWSNFPGRIRQCPGPDNALGRVKFLFPNQLDVYLHDTPGRRLFTRSQRSLSHGCVRLEQPITLADYVLQDHPEWPARRIDQVIASGERHVVDLHTPTDVYLLYWTAWADADGHLQFRHDVYGRDAPLLTLLTAGSGSPRTASLGPAMAAADRDAPGQALR